MKIAKGHYVPKEFITSKAVHEAVVKCFVAAGFEAKSKWCSPNASNKGIGLAVDHDGLIAWLSVSKEPLTIQQLFTAENGISWPDWAEHIQCGDDGVFFTSANKGVIQFISGSYYQAESTVLATRQPKEKEVKTIEDVVIELSGKLPCNTMQHSYAVVEGMLLDRRKSPVECYVCKVEEFESCAKRLGYINGYRWGIEYQANGKRPDLDDNILIKWESNIGGSSECMVGNLSWFFGSKCNIKSFKITDQRYKPADTSYLNALSQAQSLTHSEEGLMRKAVGETGDGFASREEMAKHSVLADFDDLEQSKSSWHERGELPPVGAEFESYFAKDTEPKWNKGKVAYSSSEHTILVFDDGEENYYETENLMKIAKFRPIRTDREKVIEAANKVLTDEHGAMYGLHKEFCASLYNAGMLVMPK